ncbi:hypothetical protein [Roseibacillus ishigakijimensis]|uniref:Uncharacterized protein n=1 Tax=Roseibacillus ishigakijimensis TaxID=454146 RepID=A0A934RWQ0_9BACT|nr:hypothetical protein [Roseibacillus ishigakijimensis]MBK1835545.1 hypothetical protein [Roseibacillus ishigakijimensis]
MECLEDEFVPLLIRNNHPGEEASWLAHYHEPGWNFPVARFFSGEGQELLPRRDRLFSLPDLFPRLEMALMLMGKPSAILPLVRPETIRPELLAVRQSGPWQGELPLGHLPPVIQSQAAWHQGREATLLSSNPSLGGISALSQQIHDTLGEVEIFHGRALKGTRPAKEADQKFRLARSPWNALPTLTAHQRSRLEGWLAHDPGRIVEFLTPRQRALQP